MKSVILLTSICLSVPLHAFGMCIYAPRPCAWYGIHHGQPTFVGTAVSEETLPDLLERGGQSINVTVQKVTFNVEESFDGAPKKTETVYGSGTTDDYHFKIGERYLVYGWRETDGKIRTGKCTRTAPVSEASEDIRFLHSLPTRHGGEIFGLVRFVNPGAQVGVLAGTVTESGEDGDHKSRVLSSGSYEVQGLAPGDYRETFTPDDTRTEFVTLRRSIPVNGSCAESGVSLGNLSVSGDVLDETGKPVPSANVLLYYALDGLFHPDVLLRTQTDSLGKFSLNRVEAAKFILAVQPAGSEMIFFPGTRDASKAHVIETRDGTALSPLSIRIFRSRHVN